jgi:hypothetical protein
MKYMLGVLAIAALSATACSRPGSDEHAFEWTNEIPAGTVVHLKNGVGDIKVRRGSGQQIHVVGSRAWRRGRAKDIRFVAQSNGRDVYVCAMWRNSGKCAGSGYRGRNTGGFLAMFSLFNRTTDATAELFVELPANVVVDARTSRGDVTVDGITAGVSARTSNGDVDAINVGGEIELTTSNGDVTMSADERAETKEVSLTTSNGDIRAELPSKLEGSFDLATSHGEIETQLPLMTTGKSRVGAHLQGQIGTATRNVKMRTSNGSVVVVTRSAVRGPAAEP